MEDNTPALKCALPNANSFLCERSSLISPMYLSGKVYIEILNTSRLESLFFSVIKTPLRNACIWWPPFTSLCSEAFFTFRIIIIHLQNQIHCCWRQLQYIFTLSKSFFVCMKVKKKSGLADSNEFCWLSRTAGVQDGSDLTFAERRRFLVIWNPWVSREVWVWRLLKRPLVGAEPPRERSALTSTKDYWPKKAAALVSWR